MEFDVDNFVDWLVVLFNLLFGMWIEEEDFLDVVLDKPADGVVDGTEGPQLHEGLN